MKILFDHQVFGFQRYGGISRYFTELLRRFRADSELRTEFALRFSENRYLADLPGLRVRGLFGDAAFKGKRHVVEACNRLHSVARLRGEWDVFHPTYYHPYFLRHLRGRPFVLTVYDMIHEIMPERFAARVQVPAHKRRLIPEAARLIAISENTKTDILRFFPMDPARVEVIYPAWFMPPPDEASAARLLLPGRFVLFTGDRHGYKNFLPFLEGAAPVFRKDPGLHLVCVGGGAFNDAEKAALTRCGIGDRTRLHAVSDGELAYIYGRARAFVYPSLYEGFGIPILEAFAAGCPTLLSRASCFPEIAADGAMYFEPGDAGSLTAALERILEDEPHRATLIARGRARLAAFSWDEAARRTKAVYRAVL